MSERLLRLGVPRVEAFKQALNGWLSVRAACPTAADNKEETMSKTAAAAAEKPAPIARNDKQRMLAPQRLADPDFRWRTWEATIPADTPMEHVVSRRFWRLCAQRINRGDHIRFRNDFLTRFGELVCVGIDHATGDMDMRLLWSEDVDDAADCKSELFPINAHSEKARRFHPTALNRLAGVSERAGVAMTRKVLYLPRPPGCISA